MPCKLIGSRKLPSTSLPSANIRLFSSVCTKMSLEMTRLRILLVTSLVVAVMNRNFLVTCPSSSSSFLQGSKSALILCCCILIVCSCVWMNCRVIWASKSQRPTIMMLLTPPFVAKESCVLWLRLYIIGVGCVSRWRCFLFMWITMLMIFWIRKWCIQRWWIRRMWYKVEIDV